MKDLNQIVSDLTLLVVDVQLQEDISYMNKSVIIANLQTALRILDLNAQKKSIKLSKEVFRSYDSIEWFERGELLAKNVTLANGEKYSSVRVDYGSGQPYMVCLNSDGKQVKVCNLTVSLRMADENA